MFRLNSLLGMTGRYNGLIVVISESARRQFRWSYYWPRLYFIMQTISTILKKNMLQKMV